MCVLALLDIAPKRGSAAPVVWAAAPASHPSMYAVGQAGLCPCHCGCTVLGASSSRVSMWTSNRAVNCTFQLLYGHALDDQIKIKTIYARRHTTGYDMRHPNKYFIVFFFCVLFTLHSVAVCQLISCFDSNLERT